MAVLRPRLQPGTELPRSSASVIDQWGRSLVLPRSQGGPWDRDSGYVRLRMMMSELPTIAKAAHDMREGLLRPSDLVEHCLARIEQLESDVRAWVLIDSAGARREAERPDE